MSARAGGSRAVASRSPDGRPVFSQLTLAALVCVGVLLVMDLWGAQHSAAGPWQHKREPVQLRQQQEQQQSAAMPAEALRLAVQQPQTQAMLRQHAARDEQAVFCRTHTGADGRLKQPPNSVLAAMGGLSKGAYVLAGQDIVSSGLRGGGKWEGGYTDLILRQLKQSHRSDPVLVDIGANVGAHALAVAARGYRVVAFEAAPTNLELLRTTLCANPELQSKMTIVAGALGSFSRNCSMWAPAINTGNGMIYCDAAPDAGSGMVFLGSAVEHRLDDVLQEDVDFMKMDVEGFEAHVLAGASGLFTRHKVHWLWFEYSPLAVRRKGGDPLAMLVTLAAYGFECSWAPPGGLPGAFVTTAEFLGLAAKENASIPEVWQADVVCRQRGAPLVPLAPHRAPP